MTLDERLRRGVKRLDVLIEGVRQMIDEKHDQTDLKRAPCTCGTLTRFGVCAGCVMKRLREQQGL